MTSPTRTTRASWDHSHMRFLAALAAMLTIAACSAAPAKPATTHSSTTTHTASVADVGYLAAVRPSVQGSTDADLIALGKQACGWLDGNTLLDVMQHLVDSGMSTRAAANVVTAAIPAYCPQHKDMLTQ